MDPIVHHEADAFRLDLDPLSFGPGTEATSIAGATIVVLAMRDRNQVVSGSAEILSPTKVRVTFAAGALEASRLWSQANATYEDATWLLQVQADLSGVADTIFESQVIVKYSIEAGP